MNPPPTLTYGLFVAGTLLLTAALGAATWATARLLRTWRPDFNPLLQPLDLLLRLLLIAFCLGLGRLSGASRAELGWIAPNPLAQIGAGTAVGLALALFFWATKRLLVARTGDRYYSPQMVELLTPRSRAEFALVLLALIPSVLLEELLFRSLWLGGLALLWPAPLLALVAALLFGMMHSPQGAYGIGGAALAGLLFGLLFLWAGSLLLPLVAHYVANAAQLAIAAMGARSARAHRGPPAQGEAQEQTGA